MNQDLQQQQSSETSRATLGGFRAVETEDSKDVLGAIAEARGSNRVLHGCRELTIPLAGMTVGSQRAKLQSFLNFDPEASVFIDGEIVADDYVIQDGQAVEFLRIAGDKGK